MKHAVTWMLVAGLVALLLPSALVHLDNPYYFLSSIYTYRILNEHVGPWCAALLPFLQIAIACALVIGRLRRGAFAYAFVLLLTFAALQGYTLHRGLNIDCGCFGSANENPIGWQSISISAGGAVAALLGCILTRTRPSPTEALP